MKHNLEGFKAEEQAEYWEYAWLEECRRAGDALDTLKALIAAVEEHFEEPFCEVSQELLKQALDGAKKLV